MSKADQAADRFREGFMCSQAVFSTYSADLGLSPELALRIAEPLGGGVCSTGETCGAVSGALLVIGLKHGRTAADDTEAKDRTKALGREFMAQFEARHGGTKCKELLNCDIGTDAGLAHARANDLFGQICPHLVHDAAEIVEGLLGE